MFSTLRNRALLKLYVTILVFSTIGFMSQSVNIPFILGLGGGVLEVNLITTIQTSIGMILLVPFGMLSDRLGRRPMLLLPVPLQLVGYIIYSFASHPYQLIIVSVLNGFAGMDFMPVLLSMVADVTEPEKRREALGLFFFISSIGIFLGPTIGTLLLRVPGITIRSIYQILAISQAAFLGYLILVIKETKAKTAKAAETRYISTIASLLHQRPIQGIIIMVFLFFFCDNVILTYNPIRSSLSLNLSDSDIASLSGFRNLAIMVIRFLVPVILMKISDNSLMLTGLVSGSLSGLASIAAGDYLSTAAVMFASGMSYGIVFTLTSILIATHSSPENRGVANSLFSLTLGVSGVIKMLTTPVADNLGIPIVFLLGGLAALVSVLPFLMLTVRKRKDTVKASHSP